MIVFRNRFGRALKAGWWALALVTLASRPAAGATALSPDEELFSTAVVPHLRIEIGEEGMATLRRYQQVWGQTRPERVDVQATVRDGSRVYTNVALHLKGSFTFQPIDGKPSFTLNFDKFAKAQRLRGLDKIHLNNSAQDPTYLCEKLARDTFRSAGVPAARVGHARVSLNGRDLGLYVLVEGYNKQFLKRHFQTVSGNLYDGGSGGDIAKALEVDAGAEPENRSDLTALLEATRETNASVRLARLEQLLDVDRFLTFSALEVLFQHWDGYCMGPNNFRLFQDRERSRFVFFPHGLDQILGVGLSPSSTITPQWDGLVARALFSVPGGRQRYLNRVGEVFTNHFRTEALLARIDRTTAALRASKEAAGLIDDSFSQAVQNLKARVTQRTGLVQKQLENPEQPLGFTNGIARINGWQFKRPSRAPMTGRRARLENREVLEVRAAGIWGAGSWRKLVLLEAGRYELSALARADGVPAGATNSGVILRVSGERDSAGLSLRSEWTPLSYQFEIPGLINAEVVCEFRAPEGVGMFDVSSIQLRKLHSGPSALP